MQSGFHELIFRIDRLLRHGVSLANPVSSAARLVMGLPPKVKLSNGTSLTLDLGGWPSVLKLVELASYGIDIRFGETARGSVSWRVDSGAGTITVPQGIVFGLDSIDPGIFAETFLYLTHFIKPDLSNSTIIDGGAFVGDTSLYFAARGARVIALEPDPVNFRRLLSNLNRNPSIASRITPYNWALGRAGNVDFVAQGHGGSSTELAGPSIRLRSLSVRELVDLAGESDDLILKADCKGAEWSLVSQDEIDQFRALQVEYDTRLSPGASVEQMVRRLSDLGFRDVQLFKHNFDFYDLATHGTLQAFKGP